MLKINQFALNERIAERWEEEKLFYPLASSYIKIEETNLNAKKEDLCFVEIKNLPENCWIFENEYYMLHKDKKQANSLSSAGQKVEKTLIWEEKKRLRILLIEMKTSLTYENVSECIQKIESSLNTFATFLAAHPKFQQLEKIIAPMGLICYNIEGYKDQQTRHLGKTGRNFQTQYVEKRLVEFNLSIQPLVLQEMPIPIAFRINPTFSQNIKGFTLDFEEIYQKLQTF